MSEPFRDASSGPGLDVVVTLPASTVEKIEAAAKERGETVSGWRRATLIKAVAVEGQHDTIERWREAEASMPLPPVGSDEWLRDEALRRVREPDPDMER